MKTRKGFSKKIQKGISLVEGLVTIGIYGVLSTVAVQKLGSTNVNAQAQVQANIISTLQEAYAGVQAQAVNSGQAGITSCAALGNQLTYGMPTGYSIGGGTLSGCAAGGTACSCTLYSTSNPYIQPCSSRTGTGTAQDPYVYSPDSCYAAGYNATTPSESTASPGSNFTVAY